MEVASTNLTNKKGLLDENTTVVLLQFHTANLDTLSPFITEVLHEQKPSTSRKEGSGPNGVQFIKQTERITVEKFPADLEMVGYRLIDSYYQSRGHYSVVRFIFCRSDEAEIDNKAKQYLSECQKVLSILCQEALWGVRAYCNSYFEDGKHIEGRYAFSINLSTRLSFRDGAGNVIVERPLGTDGKRQKNAATEPIRPSFRLTADDAVSIDYVIK